MHLIGALAVFGVVALGFQAREGQDISYLDPHAFVMIVGGSFAAVLLGSRPRHFLRTFSQLREFVPLLARFHRDTDAMEAERLTVEEAWLAGRKNDAVRIGESSSFESTKMMVEQLLSKAPDELIANRFLHLAHRTADEREPAVHNWEMVSRLSPSFGIVGTITGMVQMFKSFGTEGNLGPALSFALLATLYGVAFGSGIATPVAHHLQKIFNDRLNVLDRCETTVRQLRNLV